MTKLKVTQVQHPPSHPIFQVEDPWSPKDLILWLENDDLPLDFSLSVNGGLYRFQNRQERNQFILGFNLAWEIFVQ